MTRTRLTIVAVAIVLLMTSALAISAVSQEDEAAEKAVIQYRLVQVPSVMTQAQFQSVLTAQGNAGWRFLGPYAVGTPPIPNQAVLLFSKP